MAAARLLRSCSESVKAGAFWSGSQEPSLDPVCPFWTSWFVELLMVPAPGCPCVPDEAAVNANVCFEHYEDVQSTD